MLTAHAAPARPPARGRANRRHDATRPTARQRGYNHAWKKARRAWLAHHPDCAMCGSRATLVDHIVPHRGDEALFWSWRNWQSLCGTCHSRHKQRQERAQAASSQNADPRP